MGNWRRVRIVGTCSPEEVGALKRHLTFDRNTLEGWHCLCNGGACGLPNWAATTIDALGNLAERDYDEEDVVEVLTDIADEVPSLDVKVHMGGDYEADECTSTVIFTEGKATICPPLVETIPQIDQAQMRRQMMRQMGGGW